MRANRVTYKKYEDKKEGSRRKKYDKKYLIHRLDFLPDPGYVGQFKKIVKVKFLSNVFGVTSISDNFN